MSKQSTAYSFHVAYEPSELCLQARTQFLEFIQRLKPHVIADLWTTAFPEFRLAVIRRFGKEIMDGIEDVKGYFEEKQKKYLEDRDSHYFHLLHRKLEEATGAQPYGAFELLSERPQLKEKIDEVIQQYAVAFHNGLVVKLIQSKLTTEVGEDPIRWAFHSYGEIAGRDEDQSLAAVIQRWSEKWDLNAEWCRDHAVAVLREWLSHPQLSSVGIAYIRASDAANRVGFGDTRTSLCFDYVTGQRGHCCIRDAATQAAQVQLGRL